MKLWSALNEIPDRNSIDRLASTLLVISAFIKELLPWIQRRLGQGFGGGDAEAALNEFVEKDLKTVAKNFDTSRVYASYFFACLARRCDRYRKNPSPAPLVSKSETPAPKDDPDRRKSIEELLALLGSVLDRLAPEDGMVLDMFYLRNRTIEDIAHRLSINPNAVKQRLHRARGRALKQFRQAGYEDFQKLSEAFYVE